MKAFVLSTLILLFFFGFGFSQTKKDSLSKALRISKSKEYSGTLRKLIDEYKNESIEKTIEFLKNELQIVRKNKEKEYEMLVLNYIGIKYEDVNGKIGIAYLDSSLHIANFLNDDTQKAIVYINMGAANMKMGNATKVIENLVQAEKYCIKTKDTLRLIGTYMVFASTYDNLKNHKLVEKYCEESLNYLKKMQSTPKVELRYALVYSTYGTSLRGRNENKKAILYLKKGRDIYEKAGVKGNAAILSNNIANAYYELGEIENAEKNYLKAEKIGRETNNVYIIILAAINLGRLNIEKGNLEKAQKLLEEGVDLAKKNNYKSDLDELYGFLSDISLLKKDYKNYLGYDILAETIGDSLQNSSINEKVADMQVKYETEKKDNEIKDQQNQLFRQKAWLIGLTISILALAVLGYLFYNRYRLKQKHILQEAIIEEQQLGLNAVIEAQEAERKRIAKDLHDGIAQELIVLKLGFNKIQNKIEKAIPEEAKNFENLSNQLNESCTEVRNIAHVMMPPTLETLGLVPSLEMLLRNTLQNLEIKSDFEHFSLPERLDEKTELGLYRITQELLNNIIKHAQANKVILQLYQASNNLIMRLEDNGKSFDFEEARKKGSMGLLNILSRVSTLGGTFTSENGEQFGTVSTIRIPL